MLLSGILRAHTNIVHAALPAGADAGMLRHLVWLAPTWFLMVVASTSCAFDYLIAVELLAATPRPDLTGPSDIITAAALRALPALRLPNRARNLTAINLPLVSSAITVPYALLQLTDGALHRVFVTGDSISIAIDATPTAADMALVPMQPSVHPQKFDISLQPLHIAALPSPCVRIDLVTFAGIAVVIALSHRGELYADQRLLASNCSSFAVHNACVVVTTHEHVCHFLRRDLAIAAISLTNSSTVDQTLRAVERGSKIVAVVAYDVRLVLQVCLDSFLQSYIFFNMNIFMFLDFLCFYIFYVFIFITFLCIYKFMHL